MSSGSDRTPMGRGHLITGGDVIPETLVVVPGFGAAPVRSAGLDWDALRWGPEMPTPAPAPPKPVRTVSPSPVPVRTTLPPQTAPEPPRTVLSPAAVPVSAPAPGPLPPPPPDLAGALEHITIEELLRLAEASESGKVRLAAERAIIAIDVVRRAIANPGPSSRPGTYPADVVEKVADLYGRGWSQLRIAEVIGRDQGYVSRLMKAARIPARELGKNHPARKKASDA